MAVPRGKASVVLGAGTMPSRCAASSFPFRFSPPNRLIAEAFPAKPFELRTDWVDTKLSRVEKQKEPSAQSAARVIAEKRTEIERINFRLQRLLDSLLDGVVERDEYAAEKIKLMSQKKTLEDQNRALSRAEIARALDGHLCRCTGYTKIIDAVELIHAAKHNGGALPAPVLDGRVGQRLQRYQGAELALGVRPFVADIDVPGLLHGEDDQFPH